MANMLETVSGSYVPPVGITTVLREDLKAMVAIIDPYVTQVLDLMPTYSTDSMVTQWITDTLPGLTLNNTLGDVDITGINVQGLDEGFEPAYTSFPYSAQPRRQENYVQTWGGLVRISDSLKRAVPAGISNPYNHEVLKVSKVVEKAKERRWFDNVSANASYIAGTVGTSTLPGRVKSAFDWAGASPALNQLTVDGTLTPAFIDSGLESVYTAGGEVDTLACSPGVKVDISTALRTFGYSGGTNINVSNIAAGERRIIRAVDFYEGDLGDVAMVVTRQIPQSANTTGGGKAWLFEMGKLGWVDFNKTQHIPLAKTGHNTKGIIVAQGTYLNANAAAHLVFNDVTT